jgi:hypothetical protein
VSNRVLPLVNKEKLVIKGISPALPGYRVVTDLPNPLDPALPLVQVLDAGGTLLDETTTAGRVDVYCLAATRAALWALSDAANDAVGKLAGQEIDGQLVDAVIPRALPSFLAWSAAVPRTVATYELQYRPRP